MNIKEALAKREEERMEKIVAGMNARKGKDSSPVKAKPGRKPKYASEEERHTAKLERDRDYRRKIRNHAEIALKNDAEEPTSQSIAPPQDQSAKADAGKPQLSLVPMGILTAVARIREYGNRKYNSPDNWKKVDPQRYRDAMMRHMVAYISDPHGKDEESGLPHLWHLACNVAFLVELDGEKNKDRR